MPSKQSRVSGLVSSRSTGIYRPSTESPSAARRQSSPRRRCSSRPSGRSASRLRSRPAASRCCSSRFLSTSPQRGSGGCTANSRCPCRQRCARLSNVEPTVHGRVRRVLVVALEARPASIIRAIAEHGMRASIASTSGSEPVRNERTAQRRQRRAPCDW